jgi:beta-fructofuranosidase
MDWLLVALPCTALASALAAQTPPDEPLRDKTLVVWASPRNLTQHGGSALTIDGRHGKFDAIVLGELCPARWMPGSTGFSRTQRDQEAWPQETAAPGEFVQIAIAYRGDTLAMYRNGQAYAAYQMPGPAASFGPDSVMMFGKRHLDVGQPADSFAGTIKDARIYAEALSAEAIAALRPGDPAGPEPWAWFDFTGGALGERTGRYAQIRLTGDVAMGSEGLVLAGDGASLIAYPRAEDAASPSTWSGGEAVPRHVIQSARNLRGHLLADRYRPGYHFCMPEDNGMPGDPNGALYWNGRYHLMYLYHDGRAFVWGHVSSKDLVHWRHHPTALGPGEGDTGIFSGGAFVDKAGVPTITYWGLSEGPGHGVCLARSTDAHLDRWVKSPANPVVRSTHWGYTVQAGPNGTETVYGSADPSNIWIHDGRYYMLTGNLLVLNHYGKDLGQVEHQGDTAYLLRSDDLEHWEYLHPFYESDRNWTHSGEDNMCPVFLPLPAGAEGGPASDRHLLLFISHCDGCQFYIGRYEDDRFLPERHGRMTWADNAYFAPEALIDDRGRLVMWAWLLDNPPQEVVDAQGWQGIYGLPRLLWLGDDGTLRLRPADELQSLRQEEHRWGNLQLPAGGSLELDGLDGELCELQVGLGPDQVGRCSIEVCRSEDGRERTVIAYDPAEGKLSLNTTNSSLGFGSKQLETAPLVLADNEPLALRIFVDRSIVEVYANDRQAIARRVYPTLEGTGVALVAGEEAATVASVKAWELMPANPF